MAAVLVLVGLLLASCGADDRLEADDSFIDEPSGTTTTSSSTTPGALPPPVGDSIELDVDLPRRVDAAAFTWEIELTVADNDPVVVTFSSGQQVEIVIERDGEVVHRWSDGRFFAQAITTVEVQPDEPTVLSIADDLTGLEAGFYDVTISLINTEPPEPLETTIRLVAPKTA